MNDAVQLLPGMTEHHPLAPLTTIGIGGHARYFYEAQTAQMLAEALAWARNNVVPVFVLGGGSNVLIADEGWRGLVLKMAIGGIEQVDGAADGRARVVAGGGVIWDDLVRYCVENDLQGVECLSGIPGEVGACPIQNIGAYGQEVAETIAWVEAMERETGRMVTFGAAECEFGYRWSRFKGADRDRYVMTRVAFDLAPGGAPTVRYGDLTRYLNEREILTPTLADVREAVIAVRRAKGMVVDAAIVESRSCGSFFMNPVITTEECDDVARRVSELCGADVAAAMPRYAAPDGQVKLSAAWLMERAGIVRGLRQAGVGTSNLHVLALVNYDEGTAADLVALVRHIQQQVEDRLGVRLHPEPNFVGFESSSV